jgi:uncharacterized protein YbaP (TraB family)
MTALSPVPAAAFPSIAVREAPVRAEQPALWVLSDADTTIYLFGTFHALDERTDWFGPDIRAAFNSADELVLETLVPDTPAELHGVLARHSLASAAVVGAPVLSGRSRPFVVAAGQAVAAGQSAGMSVDRGADAVLRRIAVAQGKPVDGLESFDFQLAMFATLPAPSAPAATRQADPRRTVLDMRSAWRRGDGSRFASVLGALEAQSPAAYKTLFTDRNHHWAWWIAERMERPGTVFVAVGTGHLIGRDSVQQKLALRGLRTTRIN